MGDKVKSTTDKKTGRKIYTRLDKHLVCVECGAKIKLDTATPPCKCGSISWSIIKEPLP